MLFFKGFIFNDLNQIYIFHWNWTFINTFILFLQLTTMTVGRTIHCLYSLSTYIIMLNVMTLPAAQKYTFRHTLNRKR